MSYDGGISVKINNSKLKEMLEEAERDGLFIEYFTENEKYDFSFENMDSATVQGCPKDLDDLKDYILQLVEAINEDDYYEAYCRFKTVFEAEYPNLKDSFTYVSWEYSPDDETRAFEHQDDMEFKYGKPGRKKASNKKKNGPSTLKEIFPGIDMTKPSGLVIDDDGCCTSYDWKQHAEFLGEENCLFITKDVKTIEDEDYEIYDLLTTFDKCVVTTDLEEFGDYTGCGGFHFFYIIDAETNKVVYSSDKDEFFSNEPGFSSDWDGTEEELYKVLCKYTKCGDSNCSEKTGEDFDEDEKEDTSTAKSSSSKSTSAKSTKKNGPSTLKEIFPGIDMTKPSGLVIVDDGHCTSYDMKQHAEFLGEDNCLFITKTVKTIEDDEEYLTVGDIPDNCYILFNYADKYDKCVVTTDLENFGPFYECAGFHLFYIIDAKTNKVVYSSEKDEFCADFNETDLEHNVIVKLYKVLEKYTKCDGSNFYGEIDEEDDEEEDTSTSSKASVEDSIDEAEARAESWMQYYGEYIDSNPVINFDGSLFVFTGFGHRSEKDNPIVQKVIEKGGQYRSKVSGLTNYLVVDPREAGDTKVDAAIEQRNNGKNIQIVLLEDLEKALEGKTTANKSSTTSAKNTATKTSSSKSTTTKSTTKSDSTKSKRDSSSSGKNSTETSKSNYDIDETTGRLTKYRGRKDIDIVLPNGIKNVGEKAFENKKITSILIPEGVETIEAEAFSGCKNLKLVTLPNTIRKIGEKAFSNCEQLTSIVIPEGVETIEAETFSGCTDLESVTLPKTIKIIGEYAFRWCDQLTSIVIPEGVEVIGDSAFEYLEKLKSVALPNTLIKIGKYAFSCCEQLTSIKIPEGVEVIGKSAFESCKNLNSVTLPNTLKRIDDDTFSCCEQLTSVFIPEGCEEIGDGAFFNCEKLKDIYVPDSVRAIDSLAFCTKNDNTTVHTIRGSCADLSADGDYKVDYQYQTSSTTTRASSQITYTPASSSRTNATNNNSNYVIDDTTGRLTKYKGGGKAIVLPNVIKIIGERTFENERICSVVIPEGVETIEDEAFSGCKSLKLVTLPNTIRKIGKKAFANCEQLTNIVITEGVTEIDEYAFCNCNQLGSVKFPSTLIKIGEYAFCDCEQLTSIVFSEGVETIEKGAFTDCKKIKSVMFPSTLNKIGEYAFWECEQLTSIVFKGVNTIEKSAFSDCINLKTVTLPNTIRKIGDYAFGDCLQLTRVVIPKGCEELGKYVFSGCEKLKDIYIPDSVYKISDNTFSYGDKMIIHTPRGSKAERCAKENEMEVVYESSLSSSASSVSYNTAYTPASSSRTNATSYKSTNYSTSSNSTSGTPSSNSANTSSGGCYVATAVYGSYDCPEVWTLRRYRDYTLAETWYGRAFIRAYYAISPTLVKWFGHTEWFKAMWRGKLDRMVSNLRKQGVESSPYQDRNW